MLTQCAVCLSVLVKARLCCSRTQTKRMWALTLFLSPTLMELQPVTKSHQKVGDANYGASIMHYASSFLFFYFTVLYIMPLIFYYLLFMWCVENISKHMNICLLIFSAHRTHRCLATNDHLSGQRCDKPQSFHIVVLQSGDFSVQD